MEEIIHQVIGSEGDINWWQMTIRSVIIFIVSIILVRISNKRIFGKHSAFDIVMGIVLGSIMSRAITGNSPFFETILAATVLVLLHRLMGFLAWHSDWFGNLIKGHHQMLIENGKVDWDMMKRKNISRNDLEEAIRDRGNLDSFEQVKKAMLERSGSISIIPKNE